MSHQAAQTHLDEKKVTLPSQIVTPSQSSSFLNQHSNSIETRDELLLNCETMMMDNVGLVVEVRTEEFDREQIDEDSSTLNPVHSDRDDEEDEEEGDETTEQREDTRVGDEQQEPAENFVKRIDPADELGNRFECDFRACGRRMKLRTNLITHIRSHIGEKPFKCSVEGCNRAFVQKGHLKVHLNTHTGTRPFVCTWPGCEARFAQKCHLTAHLRTHTGERPFICTWPECGQAFISSSHLHSHSRVHSNERQFVCDVTGCTKVYKSKDALRRHQKRKHN